LRGHTQYPPRRLCAVSCWPGQPRVQPIASAIAANWQAGRGGADVDVEDLVVAEHRRVRIGPAAARCLPAIPRRGAGTASREGTGLDSGRHGVVQQARPCGACVRHRPPCHVPDLRRVRPGRSAPEASVIFALACLMSPLDWPARPSVRRRQLPARRPIILLVAPLTASD